MNWRPNEILRELLTSQIHKDALKQICQPVFSFSNGAQIRTMTGTENDDDLQSAQDPEFTMACEEMGNYLSSTTSHGAGGKATGLDFDGLQGDSDHEQFVYVTFVEPVDPFQMKVWELYLP